MSKCVLAVYSIYVVSIFRLYFYFEFEIALVDCYLNVPIATIIHFNGSYSHGIRIQKCNQVCQFVSNYFQLNWKRQKASTLTFRWIYIYIYINKRAISIFSPRIERFRLRNEPFCMILDLNYHSPMIPSNFSKYAIICSLSIAIVFFIGIRLSVRMSECDLKN